MRSFINFAYGGTKNLMIRILLLLVILFIWILICTYLDLGEVISMAGGMLIGGLWLIPKP